MLFHMSHCNFMARHLGVDKILHPLMAHFYWPDLHSDAPQMCDIMSACEYISYTKGDLFQVQRASLIELVWIWPGLWD